LGPTRSDPVDIITLRDSRPPDTLRLRPITASKDLDAIKSMLLEANSPGVGLARRGVAIQGMSGVGKTILAAALIEDPEIRAAFPTVSVNGEIDRRVLSGSRSVRLPISSRFSGGCSPGSPKGNPPAEIQVARDAIDKALKWHRWLIVLDDVWQRTDLRAFEVTDTPSRLLITTRNAEVVRGSGAVPHLVEELSEPFARAFLAAAVGLPEPDLPPAAADVVRECGRLPLALALAGAALRGAPKNAQLWKDVLEALARADHDQLSHEFDYPYPHALAAIQASIDFLPLEDQTAYLQLAIFSEDTPIPLAPLEKLWGIGGFRCDGASTCSSTGLSRDDITTTRSFFTTFRAISSASVVLTFKRLTWHCSTGTW
jgi:hypothetical protein